jgi:hypothetical protein
MASHRAGRIVALSVGSRNADGGLSSATIFESADLAHLERVLEELLIEIRSRGEPACPALDLDSLRTRLAVALFRCAEHGESDTTRLKRRALAMVGSDEPIEVDAAAPAAVRRSEGAGESLPIAPVTGS